MTDSRLLELVEIDSGRAGPAVVVSRASCSDPTLPPPSRSTRGQRDGWPGDRRALGLRRGRRAPSRRHQGLDLPVDRGEGPARAPARPALEVQAVRGRRLGASQRSRSIRPASFIGEGWQMRRLASPDLDLVLPPRAGDPDRVSHRSVVTSHDWVNDRERHLPTGSGPLVGRWKMGR